MKTRLTVLLLAVSTLGSVGAAPQTGTVYFFFNGYEHAQGLFLVLPSISIFVDQQVVSTIQQRTYFGVRVAAGHHTFASRTRGTNPKETAIALDIAPGQHTFVRVDVLISGLGVVRYKAYLRLVDEQEGRVMVAALRPVDRDKIKDAARVITEQPPASQTASNSAPDTERIRALSIPEEQGVYVVSEGTLRRMSPEPTGFKTTSVHGLTATIKSPRSATRLALPLEFVIRSSASTTADEYMLLQLFIRNDRREFRTLEGGDSSMKQGADRMAVPFTAHRIGTNLSYIRILAVPKGEYGFVPPGGALTGPTTSNASVFTFGVD